MTTPSDPPVPPRRPRRVVAKLLLLLAALGVAVLLVEGAASLFLGRSLRGLVGGGLPSPLDVRTQLDEERFAAAATNPGIYRAHPDPLVSYVFRAEADLEAGAPFRSNRLGTRQRPGPPAPANAMRVAVLGDSVAFGVGVRDHETLAHHLETTLAAVRGPAARPIACETVAVPGWNHRNAVHFLLDHLDQIRPDLVLFLPIGNDLSDSDGVWETGHRRLGLDLASPDPLLTVSDSQHYMCIVRLAGRLLSRGVNPEAADLGPLVLGSDISPESRRRFDENAASIALLNRACRARGTHLLLLQPEGHRYYWILRERLLDRGADVSWAWLVERMPASTRLTDDPHFDSEGLRILAILTATELLARGLVDRGAGRPLPSLPTEIESLRPQAISADVVRRRARRAREESRRSLCAAVDWETGNGVGQVYGGLNIDGSAAMRLLLVCDRRGPRLRLKLAPLPNRPDLYPLDVHVEVDGTRIGKIVVEAGDENARSQTVLDLPVSQDASAPIEVRLVPARWVTIVSAGATRVASFRPVRIECGR